MKKSTLNLIIALMSFSTLGIIAIQAYWIKIKAQQAAKEFDSKVYESLEAISEHLTTNETMVFVQSQNVNRFNFKTRDIEDGIKEMSYVISVSEDDNAIREIKRTVNGRLKPEDGIISRTYEWTEDSIVIHSVNFEDSIIKSKGKTEVKALLSKKKNQIRTAIDKLAIEYALKESSLKERLAKVNMDSLVEKKLATKGISNSFQYEIKSGEDSVVFYSEAFYSNQPSQLYQSSIFESLSAKNSGLLSIYFPNKLNSILKSIWINLLISIFLTLMMLGTFGYTIYSIIKQKKLAQIKSDFINNMTHEFKTPIATISLAIDNMLHPLIKADTKAMEKFGRIIKKENDRMNHQIERVLEAARFERQDINLKMEALDLHDLLRDLTDTFKMEMDDNRGDIKLSLNAESHEIEGDKMHLYNALRNVIENGIKYSKTPFRISILTKKNDQEILIEIKDKGIGMDVTTQKHIFDRFYRKTDGNIHQTKGFGLGLYYTKEVINKHGGNIDVNSNLNHGSSFKIRLPLK